MRRKLSVLAAAVGAVLLLGVLGLGAAFAADPTPTPTNGADAYMAKVAKILGIDLEKLQSAFTQARIEMIDDAVKAGEINQDKGEWMKQGVEKGYMDRGFGHGGKMGGRLGGMKRGSARAAPTATAQ